MTYFQLHVTKFNMLSVSSLFIYQFSKDNSDVYTDIHQENSCTTKADQDSEKQSSNINSDTVERISTDILVNLPGSSYSWKIF